MQCDAFHLSLTSQILRNLAQWPRAIFHDLLYFLTATEVTIIQILEFIVNRSLLKLPYRSIIAVW